MEIEMEKKDDKKCWITGDYCSLGTKKGNIMGAFTKQCAECPIKNQNRDFLREIIRNEEVEQFRELRYETIRKEIISQETKNLYNTLMGLFKKNKKTGKTLLELKTIIFLLGEYVDLSKIVCFILPRSCKK